MKKKKEINPLFASIRQAKKTGQLNDKHVQMQVPLKPPKVFPVQPPRDQAHQNSLADEYLYWATYDETALDPEYFPISRCMAPSRFFRIAQFNEYFAEVMEIVNSLIVLRIKRMWREKNLDPSYARSMLCVHWPEYRQYVNEKSPAYATNQAIIVQADPVPSSDLVPEKKIELP